MRLTVTLQPEYMCVNGQDYNGGNAKKVAAEEEDRENFGERVVDGTRMMRLAT